MFDQLPNALNSEERVGRGERERGGGRGEKDCHPGARVSGQVVIDAANYRRSNHGQIT